MSLLSLGVKLRSLGFLKPWKLCPTCGTKLSGMKVIDSRLYYKCSCCRGNSGYISALRGSVLEKGLRLSLHQLTALIACFSGVRRTTEGGNAVQRFAEQGSRVVWLISQLR